MRIFILSLFLIINLLVIQDVKADDADRVSQLISVLKTGDSSSQIHAVEELGGIGMQSRPAIPALVDLLKTEPLEDNALSSEIAATLEKTGIDLPELLAKSIDGQDEVLSSHLCLVLNSGDIDRANKASALLKLRLENSDPAVRRSAVDGISLLGLSDADTIRQIIDIARDRDVRVSYRAISALGLIKPTKQEVVKALSFLTKSSSAAIRYRAIVSLGQIGSEAKSAIPSLASIAQSGSGPIAKKAADSLALIENQNSSPNIAEVTASSFEAAPSRAALDPSFVPGKPLDPVPSIKIPITSEPVAEAVNLASSPNEVEDRDAATKAVINGLNDDSTLVKQEAISKITEAGETASPELISGLEKILKESDPELREASSKALVKLGTPGMAVMVAASGSTDPLVKLKAIKALRTFDRPLTTEALIALRENLKDPDEQIRTQSAISLAMAKSIPGETIPLLIQTLEVNDVSASVSATIALSKFSEEAVKPLVSALNNPNPLVRSRAVTALGLMEEPPDNIADLIGPLVEDENADVRSSATQALSSIRAARVHPEEEEEEEK